MESINIRVCAICVYFARFYISIQLHSDAEKLGWSNNNKDRFVLSIIYFIIIIIP